MKGLEKLAAAFALLGGLCALLVAGMSPTGVARWSRPVKSRTSFQGVQLAASAAWRRASTAATKLAAPRAPPEVPLMTKMESAKLTPCCSPSSCRRARDALPQ